jgi:hypothetical protein
MNASGQNVPPAPTAGLPPQVPNRFALILRSTCVGVATMIVALFVRGFIALVIAMHSTPKAQAVDGEVGGEVGWDLVTLVRNLPPRWLLLPAVTFAAGFLFGFWYFSRQRT